MTINCIISDEGLTDYISGDLLLQVPVIELPLWYKANCKDFETYNKTFFEDTAVFMCKAHSKCGSDARNTTSRDIGECIFNFRVAELAFGDN